MKKIIPFLIVIIMGAVLFDSYQKEEKNKNKESENSNNNNVVITEEKNNEEEQEVIEPEEIVEQEEKTEVEKPKEESKEETTTKPKEEKKTNTTTNNTTTKPKEETTSVVSDGPFIVDFQLDGGTKFTMYVKENGRCKWTTTQTIRLILKNGDKYGSGSIEFCNGSFPSAYKQGHLFKGWYTGKNGTGTKIEHNTVVNLKSNIDLYPYWKESIVVNYNVGSMTYNTNGSFDIEKNSTIGTMKKSDILSFTGYNIDKICPNFECLEVLPDSHVLTDGEHIYISLSEKEHKLYGIADGKGKVTPTTDTVLTGGTAVFDIVPEGDLYLKSYKVCYGKPENGACTSHTLYNQSTRISVDYGIYNDGDLYVIATFDYA